MKLKTRTILLYIRQSQPMVRGTTPHLTFVIYGRDGKIVMSYNNCDSSRTAVDKRLREYKWEKVKNLAVANK